MIKLAAKRKEVIANQRTAVKLSNLLAQLNEIQHDLDNSSDKMDEPTPPSSSTVRSSNVETFSNVKIYVKTEKEKVDSDGDRSSKEM